MLGHLSSKFTRVDLVQSEYTAALLYIPSLCFAKLAVLALVKTISPNRWDQRIAYLLAAVIVAWATTAEFAAAFMCRIPNTWDWPTGQCNDRVRSALSLRYPSINQVLACFLELPRGHKHTYRYRTCCLAGDHDIEDTNVDGQKGIYLLILCPSYHVGHNDLAGDLVLIG